MTTLRSLSMPIGILGVGPLLEAFGVTPVFAGCAAIQTDRDGGVAVAVARARAASTVAEAA